MSRLDAHERGRAKRRATGGERWPRVRGRKRPGLRAQPEGLAKRGMAGCTPREREVFRQLGRLMDVFPKTKDMMDRLLVLTDPRELHTIEEDQEAAELASVLTTLLAFIADAAGDPRPALTISSGSGSTPSERIGGHP